MNMNNAFQAMDEKQASKILGVSVQTLRNWRHLRKGPSYMKMGRAVRYNLDDLQDYMEKKRIDPEKRGWLR
ncbi:helix-turn-helix domain-containing protein [uncultured Desulfosarcina sp.]|uniref:helix-turn-helix domain-containing protein n=1 Tax=uncultured Desulfosarcina sp. TaxID=218289 RepID=UPI0037496F36